MAAKIRIEFIGGPRDGDRLTVETLVDRVTHVLTSVLPDGRTVAESVYYYHLESVRRGVFRYVLRNSVG